MSRPNPRAIRHDLRVTLVIPSRLDLGFIFCIIHSQTLAQNAQNLLTEQLEMGALTPEPQVLGIPFARNTHPMWVFDRETLAFLEVNDAAVRNYGYSRQEFLAMKITDIRPPEDVPELLRQTHSPRPQGPSTGEHWRHRTKSGGVFAVAITSWELTFRGRPAELVLARREES
jgi:PAS domain S-box-containing protein